MNRVACDDQGSVKGFFLFEESGLIDKIGGAFTCPRLKLYLFNMPIRVSL